MPAIFLGLASAESKLSCRMLSPDEFNVIANTQKQVAQCEIQEAMCRELEAAPKVRRVMDNLIEAIGAIHKQPAGRTVDAVIQVALLPSITAEPLAGKVRTMVDDFDIQFWLHRRIKAGMEDAGCSAVLSRPTGPTMRDYEEDGHDLPRPGLLQLARCAQILAAVGGGVSERMLAAGYIDLLAAITAGQTLSSEVRSTALAGVSNLMTTCPGVAKAAALANCKLMKGVRATFGMTNDRHRKIALRFVHCCICGDDAGNKKAVMDSNLGTAVGRLLGLSLQPSKDIHMALQIINCLSHVSSDYRRKLIVNDDRLLPTIKKLAEPQWLDDFRTAKNIEIQIRKTAVSCVLMLKPMSKELGNFGAIKTELATLKKKALTWAKENHKETYKENETGSQHQRQKKPTPSPPPIKADCLVTVAASSSRSSSTTVAKPGRPPPAARKPPPAARKETPLSQHDAAQVWPFCASQHTAPRSNRNKFGGLGPPVME